MSTKKPKPHRQLIWRRFLPWVVACGLLLWIWVQVPWTEVGAILLTIPLKGILLLVVLNIVIVLMMSGRWWLILCGLGCRLNYLRLSSYRLAAFGVSYFTPGPQIGGEPLQVWVLTHYHHFPASIAIASVTVDKLLEFLVNFMFLGLGLMVVLQGTLLPEQTIVWVLMAVFLLCVATAVLLILLARGQAPFSAFLQWGSAQQIFVKIFNRYAKSIKQLQLTIRDSEQQVSHLYSQAPKHLALAVIVSLLTWILWLGEFWFVYVLLGLHLTVTDLLIVVTAARIAFLLPLPGGIGTLEASQLLAMTTLGQPAAIGLTAALIIRLRDMLIGGFGLWLSSRLIK